MKKPVLIISVCIIICAVIYAGVSCAMFQSVKNVKTDFFNIVSGKAEADIDYGALTKMTKTIVSEQAVWNKNGISENQKTDGSFMILMKLRKNI